jgi:hypothetical protein
MACLGPLVLGRVFLVLTGSADFVVLVPWAMNNILSFECPIFSLFDKFVGLFRIQIVVQFFWENDLVNVSKCLCECLPVMLGAVVTNGVRHLISPRWLEKM